MLVVAKSKSSSSLRLSNVRVTLISKVTIKNIPRPRLSERKTTLDCGPDHRRSGQTSDVKHKGDNQKQGDNNPNPKNFQACFEEKLMILENSREKPKPESQLAKCSASTCH